MSRSFLLYKMDYTSIPQNMVLKDNPRWDMVLPKQDGWNYVDPPRKCVVCCQMKLQIKFSNTHWRKASPKCSNCIPWTYSIIVCIIKIGMRYIILFSLYYCRTTSQYTINIQSSVGKECTYRGLIYICRDYYYCHCYH